MPIYDYHCTECGHEQEEIILKDETPVCKKCGSAAMRRLPSATKEFRLYGEGFHKRSHKDTGDFAD